MHIFSSSSCKHLLLTILLAIPVIAFAQDKPQRFTKVDAYAKSVKGIDDPGLLAKKLTAPYHTGIEKTRAIFRWITENIAYDVKEYHVPDSLSTYTKLFKTIDPGTKNIAGVYNRKLAEYVLKQKKGICEGYAVLLKIMCDSADLKCEVVHGTAKNNVKQVGTVMKENHAWNAVMIDGKWQLLDACWSSGFCDDKITHFTKAFNEIYFLTPPEKLVINHYPSDKKWFLLPAPPSYAQFMSYPLAYDAYFESKISAFSPVNGVLEATPGKKTVFELHIPEGKTAVSASTTNGNSDIKMKKQERIIMYEYTVSSDKDDALNIYVDGKAAFSYRIVSVPRMDTVAAAKKEN